MKILLVCGGGASSGFLCQKMKVSAKEQGIDAMIDAISETELEDCLDGVNVVLFGPHLKYMQNEFEEILTPEGIPFSFIPDSYYASLDGGKTLEYAQNIIENRR